MEQLGQEQFAYFEVWPQERGSRPSARFPFALCQGEKPDLAEPLFGRR